MPERWFCRRGGRDSLSVVDIGTDPLSPRILATLPLPNTIAGPPTNLAITPDEGLALVANSLNVVSENGALKQVPDNRSVDRRSHDQPSAS